MDTATTTSTATPDQGNDWTQAAAGAGINKPGMSSQPNPDQAAKGAPAVQPAAPQQAQQAPPAVTALPAPPPTAAAVRPGGIRGFIDRIVDSLAGTDTSRVRQDPDGNVYIQHSTPTRGQQWLRIGAEALLGAGAGLAQRGAGSKGAAFGAGIQAGQQFQQKQQNQTKQQLEELANITALNHQTAANALKLTQMQFEVSKATSEFQHEWEGWMKDSGAEMVTHADSLQDVTKFMREHPDYSHSDQAQNATFRAMPTFGANGKATGFDIYQIPQGSQDEILPAGTKVPFYNPVKKEIEMQALPGPKPRAYVNSLWAAAGVAQLDAQSKQADIDLKKAETEDKLHPKAKPLAPEEAAVKRAEAFKDYQEGRRAKMEAENAQPGNEDVESQAQALVDNRTAPSLLPKRGNTYNDIMRRANELSLQQKGVPLDQTEAEQKYEARKNLIKDYIDGQAAQTIESFDKFLGHTQAASTAANALRNTNLTLLNTPINELRKMGVGKSAELQTFLIAHDTARKEFETALKNNHALTVEDVKTGEKLSNENLTPAQFQATYKEMANVAATRLRASDFRYSRATGHHVPDLVSPEGEESLQHFGIDPKSVYSQNVRPAAPANTAGLSNLGQDSAGRVIGWDGTKYVYADNRQAYVPPAVK